MRFSRDAEYRSCPQSWTQRLYSARAPDCPARKDAIAAPARLPLSRAPVRPSPHVGSTSPAASPQETPPASWHQSAPLPLHIASSPPRSETLLLAPSSCNSAFICDRSPDAADGANAQTPAFDECAPSGNIQAFPGDG